MSNDLAGADAKLRARPQFRNLSLPQLMQYRLPLAGILSILHRISGALMFLIGIPLMLYLFDLSVSSEISWQKMLELTRSWWLRLILLGFIWAFAHHFCAGIRYLLLDTHRGLEKQQAKTSAMISFAASIVLTLVFGFFLFKG
jgi:succinate dehydrogenase / fumarate reductase, cytochrome b subunit